MADIWPTKVTTRPCNCCYPCLIGNGIFQLYAIVTSTYTATSVSNGYWSYEIQVVDDILDRTDEISSSGEEVGNFIVNPNKVNDYYVGRSGVFLVERWKLNIEVLDEVEDYAFIASFPTSFHYTNAWPDDYDENAGVMWKEIVLDEDYVQEFQYLEGQYRLTIPAGTKGDLYSYLIQDRRANKVTQIYRYALTPFTCMTMIKKLN